MSVVKSDASGVRVEGEIDESVFPEFERALDGLRSSSEQVVTIDLSEVSYLASKAIGQLVALWIDLINNNRWFDLEASDRVWNILEKAGVARVFFQRPS